MRTLKVGGLTFARLDSPKMKELYMLHDIPIEPRVYVSLAEYIRSYKFGFNLFGKSHRFSIKILGAAHHDARDNGGRPGKIVLSIQGSNARKLAKTLAHELRHLSDSYNRKWVYKTDPYVKVLVYAVTFATVPVIFPSESITKMLIMATIMGLYMAFPVHYYLTCPYELSARIYSRYHTDDHLAAAEELIEMVAQHKSAR